ncbi:hypothetical protein Mapa_000388 [Marchantia paleacea]|nr:hypothetical protein Mapa_000388 [Marchantia paleacea]
MLFYRSPMALVLLPLVVPFLLQVSSAQECGSEAGGALCPDNYCCSKAGWCDSGDAYCGEGCQSGPCNYDTSLNGDALSNPEAPLRPGSCGDGVEDVVSKAQFEAIFENHDRLYSYRAFVAAAGFFPEFGTEGDCSTRRKELAAFFSQIHHETSGLSKLREDNPPPGHYCDSANAYSCAQGQEYFGRGPMQISWNYNYGQCGDTIGVDLLNDPDLVARDSRVAFKTAIWYWQTEQSPKPSCHDVITGKWSPSADDRAAGRLAGFGQTINIINGGLECDMSSENAEHRISLFTSICSTLGTSAGDNLSCSKMEPYA